MIRALLAAVLLLLFAGALLLPVLPTDSPALLAILLELRLPRALVALTYGAVLGLTGAAVQALFGNPLASPDLTGTSGGAALGAVALTYLGGFVSPFAFAAGGIGGAALLLLALLWLGGRRADAPTLLLAGLALSSLAGAATALVLALAPSPFAFYDAYDWLLGSLVDRSLPQAGLALAAALIAAVLILPARRALDALALGEELADISGHGLPALRRRVLVGVAVGVGGCVSVAGAVGFIGLVAPVLARPIVGHRPGRALLPAAAIGAALLLASDLLVRFAPWGRPVPVGVITALAGAPFFLHLVLRMRARAA